MTWLLSLVMRAGIPAKFAKPALIAGLIALAVAMLGLGKCAYDRSIIRSANQKAQLQTETKERQADANLQNQASADNAATAARQEEIDNATRNIPDQAPDARQRATVCVELRRQAAERGQPVPAC